MPACQVSVDRLQSKLPVNATSIPLGHLTDRFKSDGSSYAQGTVSVRYQLFQKPFPAIKVVIDDATGVIDLFAIGQAALDLDKLCQKGDTLVCVKFRVEKCPLHQGKPFQIVLDDREAQGALAWVCQVSASRSAPKGPVYTYKPLTEVKDNTIVDVYGVVSFVKEPVRTRGSDYYTLLSLWDSSLGEKEKLTCNIFSRDLDSLPKAEVGDVVRFHRLKIQSFQGKMQGRNGVGFQWLVFQGSPENVVSSSATYTFERQDSEKVKQLLDLWRDEGELVSSGVSTSNFSKARPRQYFNIICQVVKLCDLRTEDGSACKLVRVWDGSKFEGPIKVAEEKDFNETTLENDLLVRASASLFHDVYLFDNHAVDAANIKPGQYIKLTNLHAALVNGQVEMTLHGGTSYNRKVEILQDDAPEISDVRVTLDALVDMLDLNFSEESQSQWHEPALNKLRKRNSSPITSPSKKLNVDESVANSAHGDEPVRRSIETRSSSKARSPAKRSVDVEKLSKSSINVEKSLKRFIGNCKPSTSRGLCSQSHSSLPPLKVWMQCLGSQNKGGDDNSSSSLSTNSQERRVSKHSVGKTVPRDISSDEEQDVTRTKIRKFSSKGGKPKRSKNYEDPPTPDKKESKKSEQNESFNLTVGAKISSHNKQLSKEGNLNVNNATTLIEDSDSNDPFDVVLSLEQTKDFLGNANLQDETITSSSGNSQVAKDKDINIQNMCDDNPAAKDVDENAQNMSGGDNPGTKDKEEIAQNSQATSNDMELPAQQDLNSQNSHDSFATACSFQSFPQAQQMDESFYSDRNSNLESQKAQHDSESQSQFIQLTLRSKADQEIAELPVTENKSSEQHSSELSSFSADLFNDNAKLSYVELSQEEPFVLCFATDQAIPETELPSESASHSHEGKEDTSQVLSKVIEVNDEHSCQQDSDNGLKGTAIIGHKSVRYTSLEDVLSFNEPAKFKIKVKIRDYLPKPTEAKDLFHLYCSKCDYFKAASSVSSDEEDVLYVRNCPNCTDQPRKLTPALFLGFDLTDGQHSLTAMLWDNRAIQFLKNIDPFLLLTSEEKFEEVKDAFNSLCPLSLPIEQKPLIECCIFSYRVDGGMKYQICDTVLL